MQKKKKNLNTEEKSIATKQLFLYGCIRHVDTWSFLSLPLSFTLYLTRCL